MNSDQSSEEALQEKIPSSNHFQTMLHHVASFKASARTQEFSFILNRGSGNDKLLQKSTSEEARKKKNTCGIIEFYIFEKLIAIGYTT